MAKRWLNSADVMIDDTTGALLVKLDGVIEADIIVADMQAVTGNPGSSLADIHALLGSPAQAGEYDAGLAALLEGIAGPAGAARTLYDIWFDMTGSLDVPLSNVTAELLQVNDGGTTSLATVAGEVAALAAVLASESTLGSVAADMQALLAGGPLATESTLAQALLALDDGNGSVSAALNAIAGGTATLAVMDMTATGLLTSIADQLATGWPAIYVHDDNIPLLTLDSDGYSLAVKDRGFVEDAADESWAVLNAPGTRLHELGAACTHHVLQFTIANVDDSVRIHLEGSIDGVNYYEMGGGDYNANGTYSIQATGVARFIRGNFVSETGGENATVAFAYAGTR